MKQDKDLDDFMQELNTCDSNCGSCVTEGKIDFDNITDYCAVKNRLSRLNIRANKSHIKVSNQSALDLE